MSATSPDNLGSCGDELAVRAATEAMIVVSKAPGMFDVYSGETAIYTVDLRQGACECPDAMYRGRECKHQIRVKQALGEESIPDGVRIDPTLARRHE
ncbi:hypothetical protein Halru_2824 [Halovivax ruber XH-70]|uniref:SWIM-type domain-containing protein n=1 Tax=Halovivax ruber (strain DSM 18193 / JCM 13892 / XH-70) TaxID=797302 RepID=L0ICX1_HALRX|nr:hypothetical protein [Halovivax ruber]AGB17395.1 hypothetical protein Halru_2824 [Halovivax ruber XH-70]